MAVPYKRRVQRYLKESVDTLFNTRQFKSAVQKNAPVGDPTRVVKRYNVKLRLEDIAKASPGDAFFPQQTVPDDKLWEVKILRKYRRKLVSFDTGIVFGFFSNSHNWFTLPNGSGGSMPQVTEYTNKLYRGGTQSFGIYYTSGTAPTVGDGFMEFDIEIIESDFEFLQ